MVQSMSSQGLVWQKRYRPKDNLLRFCSFGAGVQTTALLLMHKQIKVKRFVFADTGGEKVKTTEYLEKYTLPYIKEHGIEFYVVRANKKVKPGDILHEGVLEDPTKRSTYTVTDYDGEDAVLVHDLETFCLMKGLIPSRDDRWCTHQFKINPIRAWCKEYYGKPKLPAVAVMGISFDEIERVHDPHWSEYTFEHPLIDLRMTREDCKRVIKDYGWPEPPKSGCFYCPFNRVGEMKAMYHQNKEHWNRTKTLEQNSKSYPKYTLMGHGVTLKRLERKWGEGSLTLEQFLDTACDSGHCMT